MVEPFSPLPESATIFRLAEPGTAFLPEGRVLPLPDWLRPTKADEEEGARRGRLPGLSVWDHALSTTAQGRRLSGRGASALAFSAAVADLVERAHTFAGGAVPLDLVRDPLLDHRPEPGWEGHALVEGLARLPGQPKSRYKELRSAMVDAFYPEP